MPWLKRVASELLASLAVPCSLYSTASSTSTRRPASFLRTPADSCLTSRIASHRVAELARIFRPDVQDPDHILAGLRRFYFDTALSSSSVALPSLEAFAGTDRILYLSDFPYVPESIIRSTRLPLRLSRVHSSQPSSNGSKNGDDSRGARLPGDVGTWSAFAPRRRSRNRGRCGRRPSRFLPVVAGRLPAETPRSPLPACGRSWLCSFGRNFAGSYQHARPAVPSSSMCIL